MKCLRGDHLKLCSIILNEEKYKIKETLISSYLLTIVITYFEAKYRITISIMYLGTTRLL